MGSLRLAAPDVSRSRTPSACGTPGHRRVGGNPGVAGQKEGCGQGPQAARWRVRPGGLLVAGSVARSAAHSPDAEWKRWVEELLLPLMYWQQQGARTRCSRRKAQILQTLKVLHAEFETHPITQQLAPDILADWQAWAAARAKTFQRASSAVEGRNGYLSQMHHNHRGLPKHRCKAWAGLHNFDC